MATDFSSVQVMIAVDNPMVRKALYGAFKHAGFGEITEASNYVNAHAGLRDGRFDLLVAVAEMEDFFLGHLIKEMRHSRLGEHPFPLVVMLSPVAERDFVRKVIDCGPDDILLMPVAVDQLLSRIQVLTRNRKPFVVTHDYIGPDRRKEQRQVGEVIPLLDVPNPVAAKVKKLHAASVQRDIRVAIETLNNRRVERYAVQVRWLIDNMMKGFQAVSIDAKALTAHCFRLAEISSDLKKRTENWQNGRIGEHCAQLQAAAKDVEVAGTAAKHQHLDALAKAAHEVIQEISRVLSVRSGPG